MMHISHNIVMRTTVTLDPDVATMVKTVMKRYGLTFKEALNKMIRAADTEDTAPTQKKFKVRAKRLGERSGFNFSDIGTLLDQIEGPFHK